jgi:hypothetical protein
MSYVRFISGAAAVLVMAATPAFGQDGPPEGTSVVRERLAEDTSLATDIRERMHSRGRDRSRESFLHKDRVAPDIAAIRFSHSRFRRQPPIFHPQKR